jgi:hypothetical protein
MLCHSRLQNAETHYAASDVTHSLQHRIATKQFHK